MADQKYRKKSGFIRQKDGETLKKIFERSKKRDTILL